MVRTSKRASPTNIRLPQQEEAAKLAVKRAAKVSPWRASVEGKKGIRFICKRGNGGRHH